MTIHDGKIAMRRGIRALADGLPHVCDTFPMKADDHATARPQRDRTGAVSISRVRASTAGAGSEAAHG
jgi:hypothetical protein